MTKLKIPYRLTAFHTYSGYKNLLPLSNKKRRKGEKFKISSDQKGRVERERLLEIIKKKGGFFSNNQIEDLFD